LVVAAVTVFIVVVLLLAALVARQFWLQQNVATLSSDLQTNLETLEETTQEIQDELSDILATPEHAQNLDKWEEITEVLDDVDVQLDTLEEGIDEVALALDPVDESSPPIQSEEIEQPVNSDPVDQVFTIFAALVALASLAIAILLGVSVRIHQRTSTGRS
jgi:hypothetical protein